MWWACAPFSDEETETQELNNLPMAPQPSRNLKPDLSHFHNVLIPPQLLPHRTREESYDHLVK